MIRDEEIFAEALLLPPADRETFLTRTCSGDEACRERVGKLLESHDRAGGFLNTPVVATVRAPPEAALGQIDRYQLLEKIGEGGCGVVYLAEQRESVRRRVALKLIKPGMDTEAVIARFEAERQALAMLEHPNIAKVFDAGTTDQGRPYFVMELVRGVPITKYCDQNRLTVRRRLELLVGVCSALHHAHQRGLIHRDIKPSNILVADLDGTPVPKVIDFGVAKATQGRLTEHMLHTTVEQSLGTPAYMSPEQAAPAAAELDGRSDIYSLGILIFELLVGRPPPRESDPPKPSACLRSLPEAERATVAKLRGALPGELASQLAGGLDGIVLRCLEQDRTRRYASALELGADLERFLEGHPVQARPPARAHALKRLVRNHPIPVAAGVLAIAALAAVMGWRHEAAGRERPPVSVRPPAPTPTPAPPSEARQLLAQAEALTQSVGSTIDDFNAAEALLKRALVLDPSDGEIWAGSSILNRDFNSRGFDLAPERTSLASTQAGRALRLAPNSALAWLAHARVQFDGSEAVKELHHALSLAPAHGWIHSRCWFLLSQWEWDHSEKAGRAALAQSVDPEVPGSEALAHYGEYLFCMYGRHFAEADAAVALAAAELPTDNFVCGRALSLLTWRGDTQGAMAALKALPVAHQGQPRVILLRVYTAILARKPQDALDVLDAAAPVYIDDNYFSGPLDYWRAWAELEKGDREGGAVLRERAYAECQRRDAERAPDIGAMSTEAELLGWLHREADARRLIALMRASSGEFLHRSCGLRGLAALGDADGAIPLIKLALAPNHDFWPLTPALLRLDPLWSRLRADPRFQALAEEPGTPH